MTVSAHVFVFHVVGVVGIKLVLATGVVITQERIVAIGLLLVWLSHHGIVAVGFVKCSRVEDNFINGFVFFYLIFYSPLNILYQAQLPPQLFL